MAIELSPYLNFNGNCEEAMNFYQSVLGGALDFNRFGDFQGPDQKMADDQKNKVMHSTLKSDMLTFMASDCPPGTTVTMGDSVHISIAGDDEALLTKYFEGLSKGGKVSVPLEKQMWGDTFGMFTDKFGIHWMVNISQPGGSADKA